MCNYLFKQVSEKQDEQGMDCNQENDKVTIRQEKFCSHPNSDTERLRSAGHSLIYAGVTHNGRI